jgi:hypothetical protein
MTKSFKVEGVRRGFYLANFGYFLKSNLRNLGKTWFFSVFSFLFSKHLPLLQDKKLLSKNSAGGL